MSVSFNSTKMKEFYIRSLSTFFIFPPAMLAVYYGGFLYYALLFIAIIIAGWEWNNIVGGWQFGIDAMTLITVVAVSMTLFFMNYKLLGIIIILTGSYLTYVVAILRHKSEQSAVFPEYLNRQKWFFLGSIYLSLGFCSLAYLVNTDVTGITLIWVFLATICSDTFAYIFGSIIKGKKIIPQISPNKSWSGFIAATVSTTVISYLFALYVDSTNEIAVLLTGLFIAFFAHFGDILESSIKRYLKVKDSSNIIPGHGGVLDRIDAIIFVAFYISLITVILGVSPLYLK